MADAEAVIKLLQDTIGDLTRQLAITRVELMETQQKLASTQAKPEGDEVYLGEVEVQNG